MKLVEGRPRPQSGAGIPNKVNQAKGGVPMFPWPLRKRTHLFGSHEPPETTPNM